VRPSVECVQGGERCLERGAAAVAAEFLVSGGHGKAGKAEAELRVPVFRLIRHGIGAIVALHRMAGEEIELAQAWPIDRRRHQHAISLAREPHSLDRKSTRLNSSHVTNSY